MSEDYPDFEPTFEDAVKSLLTVCKGILKVMPKGQGHARLQASVDDVATWLDHTDDPQQNGWLGNDGLP